MKVLYRRFHDPQTGEAAGAADNENAEAEQAPLKCKGDATDAQIKEWKKRYPQGIHFMVFENPDYAEGTEEPEYSRIYFRIPNRTDMNLARKNRNPEVHDEEFIALAQTTCIGGDESLLEYEKDYKREQTMMAICLRMENVPAGAVAWVGNL